MTSRISILKIIALDLKRYFELSRPHQEYHPIILLTYFLSPRYHPVFLYRLSRFFYCKNLIIPALFFSRLNLFLHGIEIAPACSIGPGLFLPHTYGTVIGAASIGDNAIIFQGSTIGAQRLVFDYLPCNRPKLGSGVTVGAGSKILGDINIDDYVTIGANAVVITDLPSLCTAVGIPAKPL